MLSVTSQAKAVSDLFIGVSGFYSSCLFLCPLASLSRFPEVYLSSLLVPDECLACASTVCFALHPLSPLPVPLLL